MDCGKCAEVLNSEALIKCNLCHGTFHYVCVGMNEMEFKKILPMNKIKWKCPSCKSGKKNSNNSSTTARSEYSSSHSIINIDANSIMEHIDTKFDALQLTIDSLKTDVNSQLMILSTKVSAWEARISGLVSTMSSVNEEISNLKDENVKLKQELDDMRSNMNNISESNHRNEQWVRRSNIQINGVPEKKNENLLSLVKNLAVRCNFTINMDTDIDFVTRIAVKNDVDNKTPKPIILKMQSRYKKDDFLLSLRKLKNCTAGEIGISGTQSSKRIFFNDHLSARNKHLLREAKRLAKEKAYAYCWVKNCTVMVRRSDQSPIIHVTSIASLNKIV